MDSLTTLNSVIYNDVINRQGYCGKEEFERKKIRIIVDVARSCDIAIISNQ